MEIIGYIESYPKFDPEMTGIKEELIDIGNLSKGSLKKEDQNLLKFFSELGNDFGFNYKQLTPLNFSQEDRKKFLYFKKGECHSSALLCGYSRPEIYKLFWGFVDVIEIVNEKQKFHGTFHHSFLHKTVPGFQDAIFDPMMISNCVRYKSNYLGVNYFGVLIPYTFIDEIKRKRDSYNFSSYLKKTVFRDDSLTIQTIRELRSHQIILPPPKLLKTAFI